MIWGSANHHERASVPRTDFRRGRRWCPYCPRRASRITHYGTANGVALMSGCAWHVRMWVRDPSGPRVTTPPINLRKGRRAAR